MKLLFYIHAIKDGGAERVMSILVNHFANKGYDVVLATNTTIPFAYHINEKVILRNTQQGCPPVERNALDRAKRFFHRMVNYRRIAKEEMPDVAISFNGALNHDIILALMGTGIPVICSEHTNMKRKRVWREQALLRLTYPFASALTVLTRRDYLMFRDRYKNLVRMPNPCEFRSLSENNHEQRENVVLAAGRVRQWKIKGFDNLVKCWAMLCHEFPEWELKIAGATDEKSLEYLNRLIAENNAERISFLGFQPNLAEIMRHSKVFCLSSRIEGMPMVLLEAMNEGCCCVAFDCETGPREIISDGHNGLIAKNQDDLDLTNKLRKVMADESYRTQLASNTRSAIKRYSVDNVLARWEILFRLVKSDS